MKPYIAFDVGGTNLNIGLLTHEHDTQFNLIHHISYKSSDYNNVIEALENALQEFNKKQKIETVPVICISASGPTNGDICKPSNLPESYAIYREDIEKKFKTTVFLINDFSAISYSIPTLHKDQTIHIPNTPVLNPSPTHTYTHYTIIGAGTGLGVSQLHSYKEKETIRYYAQAGEGGWCGFSPSVDSISLILHRYFSRENTHPLCWEDIISSSKGIPALYDFLKYTYVSDNVFINACKEIDLVIQEKKDISASISLCAQQNNVAAYAVMHLWSYLYARCCSNYAIFTLPHALFLAGGVAAKNKDFFLTNYKNTEYGTYSQNFISAFHKGYNDKFTNEILKKIPVYIISDYNVSLFGAALYAHMEIEKK